MVLLPNNQDLSAASGLLNIPLLEGIYHAIMDETYTANGLARNIILHLQPAVEQDNTTQSLPAPQQYNPFFSSVPVPQANTRNSGTKITHRDVQYAAQIVVGPRMGDDSKGIGELKSNQATFTVVIEALPHIDEALSVSIEGRRYTIDRTRPIGFSQRRYLMCECTEIQELEPGTPDITIG